MEYILYAIIIFFGLFAHPFLIKILVMLCYGKYWREEWDEYKKKGIFLDWCNWILLDSSLASSLRMTLGRKLLHLGASSMTKVFLPRIFTNGTNCTNRSWNYITHLRFIASIKIKWIVTMILGYISLFLFIVILIYGVIVINNWSSRKKNIWDIDFDE